MKRAPLSTHDVAIVAVCLGVTTVADHYRFALMLSARHGRKPARSAGVSAAAFGATFNSAGRLR